MGKPFVILATPTFERRPCIEFVISMLQTEKALALKGFDHAATLLGGDPYLAKVRNRLVGTFLTEWPQATDLFFLDDDIGWPENKIIEFLERPEDVVCGIYPKKQDNLEFPVTLELDADGGLIEKDGLFLARLIPTGFMRIKRHVLEKMAMNSAKYQEVIPGGVTRVFWNMFEARFVDMQMEALKKADLDSLTREEAIAHLKRALAIKPGQEMGEWWGEDYWFAQRWREMGGQCWVDPDIQFTHRGSKPWEANFAPSIRATLQMQAQQRREAA